MSLHTYKKETTNWSHNGKLLVHISSRLWTNFSETIYSFNIESVIRAHARFFQHRWKNMLASLPCVSFSSLVWYACMRACITRWRINESIVLHSRWNACLRLDGNRHTSILMCSIECALWSETMMWIVAFRWNGNKWRSPAAYCIRSVWLCNMHAV